MLIGSLLIFNQQILKPCPVLYIPKNSNCFLAMKLPLIQPFSGKIHNGMIPTGINPKAC
jgi:hypothetical protein